MHQINWTSDRVQRTLSAVSRQIGYLRSVGDDENAEKFCRDKRDLERHLAQLTEEKRKEFSAWQCTRCQTLNLPVAEYCNSCGGERN